MRLVCRTSLLISLYHVGLAPREYCGVGVETVALSGLEED